MVDSTRGFSCLIKKILTSSQHTALFTDNYCFQKLLEKEKIFWMMLKSGLIIEQRSVHSKVSKTAWKHGQTAYKSPATCRKPVVQQRKSSEQGVRGEK
jgi:hypothetical protein